MKTSSATAGWQRGGSLKETISSLIIAFVFAFVFRGFVIEAFVIPTGSMAPTLLGQHVSFVSPESGYRWDTDAWDKNNGVPLSVQGTRRAMTVTDPMTGARVGKELPLELGEKRKLISGDRIFVLKYLYSIFDPARFDVVVFKYPGPTPTALTAGEQENYIKRLIGLPNEEIALVDGDVFVRSVNAQALSDMAYSDWTDSQWHVAQKSERVQRTLWMPVYDSRFVPLHPERDLRRWFHSPWRGLKADGTKDTNWDIEDRQSYVYQGNSHTELVWDTKNWPIDDRYPYNELPDLPTRGPLPEVTRRPVFPVSDVRMAMGIEPMAAGLEVAALLDARGHRFKADIAGTHISVSMKSDEDAQGDVWRELAAGELKTPLPVGKTTNLEVWFVDQTIQVWVDGKLVVKGAYAWSPALRAEHATGRRAEDILAPVERGNPLASPGIYRKPEVRWVFNGAPVKLTRVELDRDIFYQPGIYNTRARMGQPSKGTHPSQPCVLGKDHFFVCGDNSPNSLDARLWDAPDPWVAADIDATIGVVPRDLLIGKAFFVYFPGILKDRKLPVPDVGRMRFIF